MGFTLETSIPALAVFLQGIFSFFSPCVLPLMPLYMGYLSGGTKIIGADGVLRYPRKKVFLNTVFFVLGVSFAFFLLGFGFTAAGRFLSEYRVWFSRIGGILVILFGLYQLGVFGSSVLGREHRLPFRLDRFAMNPLVALLLGFTFSFAWTPCVGPALAGVLLMASSADSAIKGFVLIGVYTAGFVLPFLALGLFTGSLLDFLKKHQKAVRYTVKAGGVLLILMGVMMLTGWMNGITGYLSSLGTGAQQESVSSPAEPGPTQADSQWSSATRGETEPQNDRETMPAPSFALTDQNGAEHKLADYRGKVIFLNFWATWCGPCQREMPDIQKLYEKYGKNTGDVIVLGVANPKTKDAPNNQDQAEPGIVQYLSDNGYSYPVLMDRTGALFSAYGITSFPTTFMIDQEGNVFGYVTGMLTADIMESIVRQTLEGRRP